MAVARERDQALVGLGAQQDESTGDGITVR